MITRKRFREQALSEHSQLSHQRDSLSLRHGSEEAPVSSKMMLNKFEDTQEDDIINIQTEVITTFHSSSNKDLEVVSNRAVNGNISSNDISFTCLLKTSADIELESPSRGLLLRRALSIQELESSSWLSSSFINLVLARLSKEYKSVQFLPVEFALLGSEFSTKLSCEEVIDISGRRLTYDDPTVPFVIVLNSANIHWNLLRVIRSPKPELQLYEPMGKPLSRHKGLSFRNVPRSIISWLDACCPLGGVRSWISSGVSAITKPHQINSYDCGVACLLYAERCGQGHVSCLVLQICAQY